MAIIGRVCSAPAGDSPSAVISWCWLGSAVIDDQSAELIIKTHTCGWLYLAWHLCERLMTLAWAQHQTVETRLSPALSWARPEPAESSSPSPGCDPRPALAVTTWDLRPGATQIMELHHDWASFDELSGCWINAFTRFINNQVGQLCYASRQKVANCAIFSQCLNAAINILKCSGANWLLWQCDIWVWVLWVL